MPGLRQLLATTTLAATVTAQGAEAQDYVDLGQYVVSALRTAAEALSTGVSVSVVTEEDLQKAGDIRLSSYLARLPGVSVTQSGPMGTVTKLRIRGAEPRYVAVYVDGIRVDDPTGIASEFDWGALSTADVGRIEVLRGSQSALWGASAVGGVINITSRAGTDEGLHQGVAVEGGSYGTASLRYSVSYTDDRVEASATLSRLHSDGFSAYDTIPRTKGLEADGYDATRLSFSTRYRVNDALAVGLAGFAQQAENDYDDYLADSTLSWQKRREIGLRAFAEYQAGNTEHTFEVTRYRIARDDHASWGPSNFTGVRLGFGYRGVTEVSPALTLVYGAETTKETVHNSALPAGGSTRLSGIYGEAIWKPTETLDLSLGLRQDHNSAFGNEPSGRIALAWQATPELTLRTAISTGFRAPSLYEQAGDPAWGIAPNPGVGPEKSRSFEVGADWHPGEGNSLGATLFAVDIDDAITYCGTVWAAPCIGTLPAGFTNMYENVPGRSKRRGIELYGEMALGSKASLGMSYTYTDARGPAGDRLARVPFHDLSLTLDGQIADRLRGTLALQHVAGRPAEFGVTPDNYTVVNAGLAYDLGERAVLTLRVENLFDRDYQDVPGYGTSERAAYVGLQAKF